MNVTDPGDPDPSRSANPEARRGDGGVFAPKRIYRDPHGPLGGVAGGFAGYFDIDPVITRLLWIVALFSGVGIPAYVVCWLIIPKAKVWPPPGYDRLSPGSVGQNNSALLSGFVIIGLVALVGSGVDGVGEYLLPAALIGFGVYLLCQRSGASAKFEESAERQAEAPPGPAFASRARTPMESDWAAPDDRVSKPRSSLVTPTVLSVFALVIGVMGALHAAGVVHLSVATAAAIGLVIVGAGLIVSLWLGRARGLVPIGLVLAAVMLAGTTFGSWFGDDAPSSRQQVMKYLMDHGAAHDEVRSTGSAPVGDRVIAPASLAELDGSYELGLGKLTIDLSHIDFAGETRDLDVELGLGDLIIIVPPELAVEVSGELGLGDTNTFGRADDGVDVEVDSEDGEDTGAGRLKIDYEVGLGRAEVRRASL